MSPYLCDQVRARDQQPRAQTQRGTPIVSQLSLPRLARRRGDLDDQATIPVATAGRAPAGVGSAVPTSRVDFDDLPDPVKKSIGYADITGNGPTPAPAAARKAFRYPGVSAEALAAMRAEDAAEQPPAAPAAHGKHTVDLDRLVPISAMRTVDPAQVKPRRVETPVADLCAAVGLLYAKRGLVVSL